VYIAPLKALAAEIVAKFKSALGYLKLKISELTGDMSISKSEIAETHIIVATPEKWDVVTRKTDGMMDRVNCLIIDEIHLLNDERGTVLECLVARALITGMKNQKPIRIVGLSATLPNYQDVAEFIGANAKSTIYFDGSYRPTPLKCGFYGIKETTNMKRANNMMNEIIYTNIKRILRMEGNKQVIIFAHKRSETYTTALELIEIIKERSGDAHLFDCENSWKSQNEVTKSTN
jgi:replicative superfamily II helicase